MKAAIYVRTNGQGDSLPAMTPWGVHDYRKQVCLGLWFVSTPSHGGYYVEPQLLPRIPEVFRKATFTRLEAWYEEDVDWAIVAKFIPEAFPPQAQEAADLILRKAHLGPYRAHFGVEP
jgi:hypothetical protein